MPERHLSQHAQTIFRAGIESVCGDRLIRDTVRFEPTEIWFADHCIKRQSIDRIILVGAGKASGAMAVGMIRDPQLAERLVAEGTCDMVAVARGFLYEPRWTWRAAYELGAEGHYPPQYKRADPHLWPQAFEGVDVDDSEWVAGASPHILVRRTRA